jgi:hypothetical protein
MGYLFSRERVKQSIRLGFAGAWNHEYPELRAMLDQIETNCPHLMQSFVPRHERGMSDTTDGTEAEAEVVARILEDRHHINVRASLRSFTLNKTSNFLRLTASINLRRQSITSRFISQLSDAFAQDYHIDNIMDFESRQLQWRSRFAWTDPKTNRRRVHNIGDYLLAQRLGQQGSTHFSIIRLAQVFVYQFLDTPYLFVIGNLVEEVPDNTTLATLVDPVLNLEVWKVKEKQVIYGLPAIDNQALYFIPAPLEGPWLGLPTTAMEEFVLSCRWSIDFL